MIKTVDVQIFEKTFNIRITDFDFQVGKKTLFFVDYQLENYGFGYFNTDAVVVYKSDFGISYTLENEFGVFRSIFLNW